MSARSPQAEGVGVTSRYAAAVICILVVLVAATSQYPIRDLAVIAGAISLGVIAVEFIRFWYDV
jgi:hypothetical protein